MNLKLRKTGIIEKYKWARLVECRLHTHNLSDIEKGVAIWMGATHSTQPNSNRFIVASNIHRRKIWHEDNSKQQRGTLKWLTYLALTCGYIVYQLDGDNVNEWQIGEHVSLPSVIHVCMPPFNQPYPFPSVTHVSPAVLLPLSFMCVWLPFSQPYPFYLLSILCVWHQFRDYNWLNSTYTTCTTKTQRRVRPPECAHTYITWMTEGYNWSNEDHIHTQTRWHRDFLWSWNRYEFQ